MLKNFKQKALQIYKENIGSVSTNYSGVIEDTDDLSSVYTPGIAGVSELLAQNPRLASEYSMKGRAVVVVSDGSAVLGLGNIGPYGALPVMEGKCALFKRFGGVDAFPLCLDTQDPEKIIETVKIIAPAFGGINLEDISAPNCFFILKRLQEELDIPVIHDDNQGTGVVVLAGIINALKVKDTKKENVSVVVNGAGAAGVGIFNALYNYGVQDITFCDSKGSIYKGRPDLSGYKLDIAEKTNKEGIRGNLKEVLVGKDIFIGVSKGNLLSSEDVRTMAVDPIIFALANPTPEIMPDAAREGGAFIVATGRSDFPNQINNSLAFPGIFKGALQHKVSKITEEMLANASIALASVISNPTPEKIIPGPFDEGIVRAVSDVIVYATRT